MQINMVKRHLGFQKKTDNLCKGAAIPPLYGGGHMSKKIDYSNNKKIENNSFGNGTHIADNIVNNIVNNIIEQKEQQDRPVYKPEPVWRSPLTLAVLTWLSCAIGILSLLPLREIVRYIRTVFSGSLESLNTNDMQISLLTFVALSMLFIITLTVRRIAKLQTRHPLICNFAISGYGRKIVIEKIYAKCPKCGGKMRYYNKPIEWEKKIYSDGKVKREVTKRIPVLECKRNHDHYYVVDCAEDRV